MVDQTFHYIFLGILISLVTFLFVLLGFYFNKLSKEYNNLIMRQAVKRNGKISRSFVIFGDPTLKFSHDGVQFKLYTINGRFSTTTYLEAKLDFRVNLKMRIYREKYLSKFGKLLGIQDIQIWDSDFDENVILKGSDEKFIRKILTYEIRSKIVELTKRLKIIINLNRGLFLIVFPDYFKNENDFDEIIDLALKMTDKIKNPEGF